MIGGPIILMMLSNHNWFKKENFKFKQQVDRKELSIRFKKMEKDLKLKETPPIPPREPGLAETIQGINPDIIKTIAGALNKDEGYEEDYREPEKPDIAEIIADVAKSNPELVTSLVDKFTKKPGGGDSFPSQD